ncbi:MAG: diguanylate cyclase, partial [Sporomusaceae bacterium]|nr:diguanylate cyclase [Sporomusaceae bacterium]
FKKYNDTYGHGEGDTCLITVARTLRNSITRAEDFVVRYGGEEFAVILPNTDGAGAKLLADKILENIRSCGIPHKENGVAPCVTVSIGVVTGKAEYPDEAGDYIRRADEMLYQSKRNGRNRYSFTNMKTREPYPAPRLPNIEYAAKLGNALANITKMPILTAGIPKNAAAVIAETGCRELNTHRVGIWLLATDAKYLKNMTYYDLSTGKHAVQENFDLSERAQYINYLKSERLLVISDAKEPNLLNSIEEEYGPNICAMLDAPIRIGGELVGVVCIEQDRCDLYPEKREWSIEEQNFASSLADLMALAMMS